VHSGRFYPVVAENASPMKVTSFFEGLNSPPFSNGFLVSFDIETYCPNGFPHKMEDPIVNFSLAIPFFRNSKGGMLTISLICDPCLEKDLLATLHQFLFSLRGAYLLTYNGSKFDVKYVTYRGNFFDLNFNKVFAGLSHIDLFKIVKWLNIRLPSYSQRAVERFFGVNRIVRDVSGSSYHLSFVDFLTRGS
jgi:DNA polymerase elongation subunit (family B)